jgi:perosamine synthetase
LIPHSRPFIGEGEVDCAAAVIRSGMFIGGNQLPQFKENLRQLSNGRTAEVFSSGRTALLAALLALKLPKRSSVIVQTYVCDAVPWAIREAGLEPCFCDVGSAWTASSENVASVLTEDCSALILAPPFGLVQSALEFRKFNLPIVHDLCQACPAVLGSYDSSRFGDIAVLSFHPTKYICAAGGGAAIDFNGKYAGLLGEISKAKFESAPFTELQAAIGLAQLSQVESFKASRAKIFDRFIASASEASSAKLRTQIDVEPGMMFRFPLTTIGVKAADRFSAFASRGVTVRHGIDQLSHRADLLDDALFSNAVSALNHTISVPFYPLLAQDEIAEVARSLELLG